MTELKIYFIPGGVYFVEIPPGIPDQDEFGMHAGEAYNQLYTGNSEYEFHSQSQGILPPISTGIKVAEYVVATVFDIAETVKDYRDATNALKEVGGDMDKFNYVIFKKRA